MSKSEVFRERLRAAERVRKLLAMADKHPDTHEGKAARERAGVLIAKHGLDSNSLKPKVKVEHPSFDVNSAFMKNFKGFAGPDKEDYTKYDPETGRRKSD